MNRSGYMYFIFQVLPKLIVLPLAIYFYFYFRRIAQFFKLDVSQYYLKIIIALLSLCFVWNASYLFGFWAVVVFHILAFAILMDIIHKIVMKKNQKESVFHKIYQSGLIPILCLFLVLGYGYWNIKNVHQTSYTVYTDKDISQNYKVVLITDLHFGTTMDRSELDLYCQKISQLNPDVVLLGGDIVDERSSFSQMQDAFEGLGQIKTQYGIYYVYGNHDQALYSQIPPFHVDELKEAVETQGIQLLLDRHLTIQDELTIIGRRDRTDSLREPSSQLLKEVDVNDFILMLDHQPVDLQTNDDLGYDLQMSGHTHAGQMFPVGLVTDILGFGEMNYGYRQMDHLQVIVSSGIAGWGYPLRTGAHSEYVVVDIVKK